MATYEITLTGIQDPVDLGDLGIFPIAFDPPNSDDIDLIATYGLSIGEINSSNNLITAIQNNWLTAKGTDGTPITQDNIDDIIEQQQATSTILNKFDATTAPGVGDDINDGYSVGSIWVNISTDEVYTCTDNTAGSAVWVLASNEATDWFSITNKPTEFPPEDHLASKVTDFQTQVSANTDVTNNSNHRNITGNPHSTTASDVGIDDTDDVLEGSTNLYFTDTRVENNTEVSANTNHRGLTNNPHSTTASQVGIDDTDDISEGSSNLYYTEQRVVNNAQVSQNTNHRGLTNNPHSTTKSQVGLGNVDNVQQIPLSQKGANNGVAPLDNNGDVPLANIPDSLKTGLVYKGSWNANTNTPTLSSSGGGTQGDFYIVSVAGTTSIDGESDWQVGDWIVNNGSQWDKVDNSDKVSSVNGQTGVVVLDTDDVDEGSTNLYFTDTRVENNTEVSANTNHRGLTNNPHNTTASQVGIDDTDDVDEGSTNLYYTETRVDNNTNVSANTTHRGRTDNPHTVTPAQVGNDTAQWNADQIQGIDVDDTDIADDRYLKYNSTSGNLEYVDLPLKTDSPVLQIRRTTTITLPTSWTDLNFDTVDLENEPTILERDDTNTDRVLIKSTGIYSVVFYCNIDDEMEYRLRVNDSTVVPGSERSYGNPDDSVDIIGLFANGVLVSLTAGDYITAQVQANSTAENIFAGATLLVTKQEGIQGQKGDAGSGASINVEENGSFFGTFSDLNFEGNVELTDDGGGQVTFSFPDTALNNTVYVAKNGNDTSGIGTVARPLLTIGGAINYVNTNLSPSAGNPILIQVSAGFYTESPLVVPQYVSIKGSQARTVINASNPNADLLTIENNTTLLDFACIGVTGTSNAMIRVSGIESGRLLIQGVFIEGAISNGIICENTTGTLTVFVLNSEINGFTGDGFQTNSNIQLYVVTSIIDGSSTATLFKANGDSTYIVQGGRWAGGLYGFWHNTTGEGSLESIDLSETTIPVRKENSAIMNFDYIQSFGSDWFVTDVQGLRGAFLDVVENDQKTRFFDEISVGIPGQGKELSAGEGDMYVNGMKVYTFNGSTYTDVTEEASSSTGSTFTFPNNSVNTAIYISSQRFESGTMTPVKWLGFKHNCTTAIGGGTLALEYWNGSSWVEFNHISSDAETKFPFAKQIFQRVSTENVRFSSCALLPNWVTNDPVSLGMNLNWVRIRIVSSPTTLPVFQQIKLHTNHFKTGADGFTEYFGRSRFINSIRLPNFEAANNSPSNQDLYVSDNLGVGLVENEFENGTTDRSGQALILPTGIDTSCVVNLNLVFHAQQTGNTEWIIRWAVNKEGDALYNNTGSAPTVAPNEQSVSVDYNVTATNQQLSFTVPIDISDYIANRQNGSPDVLFVSIQRNGGSDANNGNMSLLLTNAFFTQWSTGGRLSV
jgi:hypothetical protein